MKFSGLQVANIAPGGQDETEELDKLLRGFSLRVCMFKEAANEKGQTNIF